MGSRGRAVFARSVHNGSNNYLRAWREEAAEKKRRAREDTIRRDILEYDDESWSWEDYGDEEEWDWAPVDSYWPIEEQSHVAAKPTKTFAIKALSTSNLDSLARRLQSRGAILEKEKFGSGGFCELQKKVLQDYGPAFCSELSQSVSRFIHVAPAPVSADVQERFLEARKTLPGNLKPGYHGTNVSSLPSIYEKGLLIPGNDNGVHVANGSAHGLGVYTARVSAPSLSWGFCRAPTPMERRMVVCGILDDAPVSSCSYTMGVRTVSRESRNVRHVGDAMVIFDDRRVAPLFEVTIGDLLTVSQSYSAFDWVKWRVTVDRVLKTFPAKTQRLRGPPVSIAKLRRQRLEQQTVIAYLTRRSASKRNPKIVSKKNVSS